MTSSMRPSHSMQRLNNTPMMCHTSYCQFKNFLLIVLAITAFRICYLLINHRDLDVEEAQYWIWSQHLAFGYPSKPPLISWFIRLATIGFGHEEWAIRLFSPCLYFISAIFIYKIGKILSGLFLGFWAGLTFLLLPGVSYSTTIISTDPFLLMFWSIALYYFICALRTEQTLHWIICGIAIGFGLLSKYTMLVFFLCAGIYLIFSPAQLNQKQGRGILITFLLATLLCAPNLIWNFYHQNITFDHVINHNIQLHEGHLHFKNALMFIVSQVGLFGPILIIGFLFAIIWRSRIANLPVKLLLCFSLPMLLLVMGEALLSRANSNWAAVSYPSTTLLAVAFLEKVKYSKLIYFSNFFHGILFLTFCSWELALAHGLLQTHASTAINWQEFSQILAKWHMRYPNSYFVTNNREIWSKSSYYGRVYHIDFLIWDPEKTVMWYKHKLDLNNSNQQDFIFIGHHQLSFENIYQHFNRNQLLTDFTVSRRLRGRQEHIYIYHLQGFLGY